jgi:hypothetical protein
MKTEYKKDVLNAIKNQEFYNVVDDFVDYEIFEDVLDFMLIYEPNWLVNLGDWSSEFLETVLICNEDLYEKEDREYSSIKAL